METHRTLRRREGLLREKSMSKEAYSKSWTSSWQEYSHVWRKFSMLIKGWEQGCGILNSLLKA